MGHVLCCLALVGSTFGVVDGAPVEASYLYQPAYCIDDVLRGPAEVYVPQPGDLFFCSDSNFFIVWGHRLAGAAAPQHCGTVVARSDGTLALLEAGPYNTLYVSLEDLGPALHEHAEKEKVWIRRRRVPLTPEQSQRLTAFAEAQENKGFATWRMVGQLTPFRSRGPLRTRWMGKPAGDRCRYFCAELTMEACVAGALVSPADARPSATFPRDLFFPVSPNPFLNRHLHLECGWYPPARWLPCPGMPGPCHEPAIRITIDSGAAQ